MNVDSETGNKYSPTVVSVIPVINRCEPAVYVFLTCAAFLVGSFFFFSGLIAGAVLIWGSPMWSRRVKIWATFLTPVTVGLAVLIGDFHWVGVYFTPVITAFFVFYASAPMRAAREASRERSESAR